MRQTALAAKTDERVFNELVTQDKSWILRCAAQTAGRYVTDSDDIWSVALIAYTEAVRDYDANRGEFHAFAAVVIRRRVIDHLRLEGRTGEIAVDPAAFEDGITQDSVGVTELSVRREVTRRSLAEAENDAERAREEIAEMQAILRDYGFSFFDLAAGSPKAEKTKISCAKAVRTLIASAALMAAMRLKHLLPIMELSRASGVIRKILERYRRYIIASAEILDGDFPILASYLQHIKRG